jgi:deoxyhypusine synthase
VGDARVGIIGEYGFDLDLHAEVFEACAYHRWACSISRATLLGTHPRRRRSQNYNLQPEPALGQIPDCPTCATTSSTCKSSGPVTDGSLSSCFPAEAVTWGKVDKDTYMQPPRSAIGLFDRAAVSHQGAPR